MKPWIATTLALLICAEVGDAAAQSYAAIRSKYENSIVFIQSKKARKDGTGTQEISVGTGFVISQDGHVMTASHVVLREDGDHNVETLGAVRSRHERGYRLEPIRRDEPADVMVLQFPDINVQWRPIEFGDSKVVPKDADLYTLGFPGTDLASATGLLSSKHGPKGMWQTTIPINRGNSGGPVFDAKGRVIAVAMAGEPAKQLVTYAVPESHISGLRQIATSIKLKDGIYFAKAPTVLHNNVVVQGFQFYESVEPNDARILKASSYCLPEGYRVTNVKSGATTKGGMNSKLIALAPDPDKENCVSIKAMVASDKALGTRYDEPNRGWFGMNVLIEGSEFKKR